MQKEQILDFNRRLSQCNRGELVVITYDIFFAYVKDAREGFARMDHDAVKTAIHKAQATLGRLIATLDFQYEIAGSLYALYQFSNRELSRALYENRPEGLEEAEKILKKLYIGFVEAARQDTSGPLMSNAQQVVAGMTYGRGELVENFTGSSYNRGFLA